MGYIKDLVSVIIPTYNQEKFIAETLESVINQTYQNLEIIVMDDGSADRNPQIIKEYAAKDERIVPILSPFNEGFSKNTNKGLKKVTGEFVAKLDGDDIMMPKRIEKQLKAIKTDPNNCLCYTDAIHFDSDTGVTLQIFFKNNPILNHPLEWPLGTDWRLRKKIPSIQYTTILARSEYYCANLWDERLPYKNEVLHTLANHVCNPLGKWIFINEPLTRYRVFPDSMSKKKKPPLFLIEEQRIFYAIASTNYPAFTKELSDQNNFYLFRALVFNHIPIKYFNAYLNLFKREAGLIKLWYLLLVRFYLKLKR